MIKEVRATLCPGWIRRRFPELPMVLLLRHPCAVALSRMRLGWATDADIAHLLGQPRLVEDFLGDRLDLIRGATSEEAKHAVVWCVSYLVPLSQLGPEALTVVFHENMVRRPQEEIPRVFEAVGLPYSSTVLDSAARPSPTSRELSAVVRGGSRLGGWKERLWAGSVRRVLDVVQRFGLGHLYGEGLEPLTSRPFLG